MFGRESSKGLKKEELFERLFESIDRRFGTERLEAYYNSPVKFAREILHIEPVEDQVKILEALAGHGKVAVRSGHGVGKTKGEVIVFLWFMCTRPHAIIPVTAPTAHQLEDVFWGELIKSYRQMESTFRNKFEYTSDRFFHRDHKETWYGVARTAKKENPEALQGFHGEHLLFLIDEGAGVADEIFEVAEGSLTQKDNMVLMCGNPTRLSGYFYDSFHLDRGRWECLHFSSLKSPLVDKSFAKRMGKKYGENSNAFRVRVLGEFPTSEEDQLIPIDLLEKAMNRTAPEQGQVVWGLDVARFGSDESALCKRKGEVIKEILTVYGYDTMKLTGWIVREIEDSPPEERPVAIYVDVIGIGSGVCDRLRELGYPVIDVNVAETASLKNKFFNLRSELWWKFKDWLQSGLGKICNDEELLAQASSVRYGFDSSGRIKIEAKEEMKKRIKASPDRADAAILTMRHDPGAGQGRVDVKPCLSILGDPLDDPKTFWDELANQGNFANRLRSDWDD